MKRHQPPTFFDSYRCRLAALAEMHGIKASTLKALIEDALRKKISYASEKDMREALMRVAKLKISVQEIKFLFNRIVVEAVQDHKLEPLVVALCQDEIRMPYEPTATDRWRERRSTRFDEAPPVPSLKKYNSQHAQLDADFFEKAWNYIQFSFDSTIASMACSYDLPLDVLEAFTCDRLIFRRSGQPPCPVEWFINEVNETKATEKERDKDPGQDERKDEGLTN